MRIALDSGPLAGGDSIRGIGVYVRELTKHIKNVDIVDASGVDIKKYDIVHFTRFNPFRISLPFSKPPSTKFVLTVYDLIPLIYPKNYPPGVKGGIVWMLNKYLIRKNVDAVITISETSKKDICRLTGIDPHKVFVTYLAAPEAFKKLKEGSWKNDIREKYKLPAKFVLYVGDVNYNKNLPNIIKACDKSKIKLVIAGKQAQDLERMDLNHPELVHLKNVDWSNVIRLGFVPDEDLVKLYNLATVYIQASFYEGFSLPPLQAVVCGTPLAVSKNQCHVEVFGNEFSFFDPNSIESIVAAIAKPNILKRTAREYSWDKTAKDTLRVYENL